MGRGRAKAKQTKVARELKYSSPTTNFSALERELHHGSGRLVPPTESEQFDDASDEGEGDDYGRWASGQS